MVDLSGAANKLMGAAHYCSSWNLLNLHHSSTYKVAQRQQQQEQQQRLVWEPTATRISGNNTRKQENSTTQRACSSSSSSGGRHASSTTTTPATTNSSSQRKVSLYSRPGRSPISLQRQTNARLARHRLRIQQQRQEQLAAHLAGQQKNRTHKESSFYLINGLHELRRPIGEPAPCSSGNSMSHNYCSANQHQLAANRDQLLSSSSVEEASGSGRRTGRDTSIEICDTQLGASSANNRARPSSGANVVVYKSINMTTPTNSRSDYEPFFASGGSSSSGSSGRYVRAERVDEQPFEAADDSSADDHEVKTICSSEATSTLSLNRPFCKICHLGNSKNGDKLISPCRCSGTMRYIHCGCLLRWLEISNKTNEKPMSCELCAHEYTWHKKFNYQQMRLPKCSFRDIALHLVFVIAILAMIASALAPILFKKSNSDGALSAQILSSTLGDQRQQPTNQEVTANSNLEENRSRRHRYSTFAGPSGQHHHMAASAGRLAGDEKFMLFCAASFFVSFFLAIYTQTKARDTLYGLIVKFLSINQTYYITEYDHEQHNNPQTNVKQQQQQQHSSNNQEEPRTNRKSSTAKS